MKQINPDRPESTVIEKFVMDNEYSWAEILNYGFTDGMNGLLPVFRELYYATEQNCKNYGADIVADILSICEQLVKTDRTISYFYVGIRTYGTDHAAFIESRLYGTKMYGRYEENYLCMYKIVLDKTNPYDKVELYELQKGQ